MNAADVLQNMADTFRERNAVYGDNYKMVGKLMAVLFPEGAPPSVLHSDQFHLFELILVKLSRFAISELKHVDSIHDAAVYGAMIEAIITEQGSSAAVKEIDSFFDNSKRPPEFPCYVCGGTSKHHKQCISEYAIDERERTDKT